MLGQNIRNLRKERGITQADFAEKIGISLDTMSRWENERREPRYSDILKMTEILQVPPSKLLETSEENTANNISLEQHRSVNCTQIIERVTNNDTKPEATQESQDIFSLIITLKNRIKKEALSHHECVAAKDLLQLCLQTLESKDS